jgi:hypothetical protein
MEKIDSGKEAPKKTILIGGSHCEWGWLFPFVARARKVSRKYDKVIVSCEYQYRYLFEDFANEFEFYDRPDGQADRWLYKKQPPLPPEYIRRRYRNAKLFYPNEKRCKSKKLEWFKYGKPNKIKFDVLLHARALKPTKHYDKKIVKGTRNWDMDNWKRLSKALNTLNLKVASIGSIKGAYHIEGTQDYRGVDLKQLCNTISGSGMIVGMSSGPCHLAMLCGCKAIVWTHAHREKSLNGKTNKWRYTKWLNPFKVPVKVVEKYKWDIPPNVIIKLIRNWL